MAMHSNPVPNGSHEADARSEIAELRAAVEGLMTERVTPALGKLVDGAEAAAVSATNEVRHQAGRLADVVHERPLAALGLAALVGFVAAALIRR